MLTIVVKVVLEEAEEASVHPVAVAVAEDTSRVAAAAVEVVLVVVAVVAADVADSPVPSKQRKAVVFKAFRGPKSRLTKQTTDGEPSKN